MDVTSGCVDTLGSLPVWKEESVEKETIVDPTGLQTISSSCFSEEEVCPTEQASVGQGELQILRGRFPSYQDR